MKLQQIVGKSRVSDLVRHRLEHNYFHNGENAQRMVKREFPDHIVTERRGEISVLVRDKSFAIAVFKELI